MVIVVKGNQTFDEIFNQVQAIKEPLCLKDEFGHSFMVLQKDRYDSIKNSLEIQKTEDKHEAISNLIKMFGDDSPPQSWSRDEIYSERISP